MFSGAGGFSLAFTRVFPDGKIIGCSEIDKNAINVYEKHFPGVKNYGSIKYVRPEQLPDFDICTFGFPCQDVSVAGKRKGFDGQRSSLFYEAIRIIDAKRPKYFVFENVKGLFSSGQGQDFIEVLQSITDIGYNGQWQLINTKWFLPQNRERIFFVGYTREESRPEIFPISESLQSSEESQVRETKDIAGTIGQKNNSPQWQFDASTTLINELKQVGNIDTKGHNSIWGRVYDPEGVSATINSEGGGLGAKTGLYTVDLKTVAGTSKTRRGGVSEDHVYTLDQNSSLGIVDRISIRRLTPKECERLQGFPDNWTEGASDTQRYKLMGNAVTVDVVEAIFNKLKAVK